MLYQISQISPARLEIAWTEARIGRCFVGFDAFTDDICAPVDQRIDCEQTTRFANLKAFGDQIAKAAGNSANLELLQLERRIGGNAAILANLLGTWHHAVHLAATVGTRDLIEPLFAPLVKKCAEIFPLGASPHTDALEFEDGKLLLGKMGALLHLSSEEIFRLVGPENLFRLLEECDLFASANWTMLAHAQPLWRRLRETFFADLSPRRRIFLVDLADPRKRPAPDLQDALMEISRWRSRFEVVLSVNCSESAQVSRALGLGSGQIARDPLERQRQSAFITESLQIAATVVHGADFATVAAGESLCVASPTCTSPLTSTGGGDHFNAGLCHALLCQLSWPEVLAFANATSGYFVRSGRSPTLADLREFSALWRTTPDF